ncbi:MAG: VOC family protein [Ktedonobacteraceae bacterium]|nr:VOC family protein [Ktedonobacteraceae bacterium]
MMNYVSLEGLSLHVSDLEQSIAFYTRIPGAELLQHRAGQFARVRIGTGYLHLVQLPGQKRFHMEFDAQNVQEMYEQLCAAGLPASTPKKHPWGKTDFRLIDPDGYALEFGGMEAPSAS